MERSIIRSGLWTVRVTEQATLLARGDDAVFTFDLDGRPVSWWTGDTVYKRSLASDVHERRRGTGGRERRILDPRTAAERLAETLEAAAGAPDRELSPEARLRLEEIRRWTIGALLAERRRFDAAYRPVAILPPDQYLSVVLQATFGCTWNRCTFCSFYQGQPFAARSESDFAAHVTAVRELLGRAAALRKSIFLADGNALVLANARILPFLEIASEAFPGRAFHGFVDVTTGERKSPDDWRVLRQMGLDRVHVGIETGHDPLLRWMEKPGGAGASAELVKGLKAAGLRVGAIFMVGAGGDRFARDHVADTLALAARLPLGEGDIVYLSPFVEHPGSEYARRAARDGTAPLDSAALEAQRTTLRDGIRRALPNARVALYDLREFLY